MVQVTDKSQSFIFTAPVITSSPSAPLLPAAAWARVRTPALPTRLAASLRGCQPAAVQCQRGDTSSAVPGRLQGTGQAALSAALRAKVFLITNI